MDANTCVSSYPGVACDIPAHSYQFTFANNLNWSSFYAAGPEIHRYLKNVARRYDVERYVKLRHLFLGAQWQASDGKWEVEIEDLEKGRVRKPLSSAKIRINDTNSPTGADRGFRNSLIGQTYSSKLPES